MLQVIFTLKSFLKQQPGLETDVEAVLRLLAGYFIDHIIPEFEISPRLLFGWRIWKPMEMAACWSRPSTEATRMSLPKMRPVCVNEQFEDTPLLSPT